MEIQTSAGIKKLIHDLRKEGVEVYVRPSEIQFRAERKSVLEQGSLQHSVRRLGKMISNELSSEDEAMQLERYDQRGYDLLVEDYDEKDQQLVVRPVDRRRAPIERKPAKDRAPRLQVVGEEA